MKMPLEGIRVLDWTIWQMGPVGTAMLADLGADVIKIEERNAGDPGRGLKKIMGITSGLKGDREFLFEALNRNKRGIAVDMKKEKGQKIVRALAAKSDVFVHNFRKGVPARLGMDYDTLAKYNPKLVYANASGYGPKGPDAFEPSFDFMGLARSGLMTIASEPGMPPLYPVGGLADQMGGVMLAYGILVALLARERLGVGQEIDVSQLGSMMQLQGLNVSSKLTLGIEFPHKKRAEMGNPLWNYYRCADDRWICLAMLQADRYWHDFCSVMGIQKCEKDARFADVDSREKNCQELIGILDRVFATRVRSEWMRVFKENGSFIYTAVNTVSDLPDDPQVIENKYVDDFDHPALGPIKVLGIPVGLSKTPGSVRIPAPELGQHTEEILIDLLGYTWDEIAALKDEEII